MRYGLLLVTIWTVLAVPVALLIGRVMAGADRSVADEAAAYLRRERRSARSPRLPRRRVATVLAGAAAVVAGSITLTPSRAPVEQAAPITQWRPAAEQRRL